MPDLNEDSSPLLTSGSVVSLPQYCLWGMLAKRGVSSWVLTAPRQLGNTQPVFHNLCFPALPSKAPAQSGGKVPPCLAWQCSVCSAAPAFWTPCGAWDGEFWFFHIQVEAVNVKHPICMLMRVLCIFNI